MTLRHQIKTAVNSLRGNKSRSILTILGIVIGITAIIIVMAIGEGAKGLILGRIQGMGSKTIVIEPGRPPTGPSDMASVYSDSLKEREFQALKNKNNVPGISEIAPIVLVPTSINYGSESKGGVNVVGTSGIIDSIFDIYPAVGNMFAEEDVNSNARVAVIGSKVKEDLFGLSDALGEKIKIKNQAFKIVGIYDKKGQVGMLNIDETVIVPYTAANQYLSGTDYYHEFIVQAVSEDEVSNVVSDIQITLRNLHNITDPNKDDFHVMTQANMMEMVGQVMGILTALLVSVAAISLLVGGVGIMNIMFVSVTERTKEIGLRKALGATDKDIMNQFLFEAIILTGLGGLVGIILGAGLSFIAAIILSQTVAAGWSFSFPISAAIVGISVSVAIGLIFGLYPAKKASQKSPIEALRYE